MEVEDYFKEDLTFLFGEKREKEAVITKLAEGLFKEGYVKSTYCAAVLEREDIHPTGLDVEGIGVAIPHTDQIHVEKAAISIGLLEQPVQFGQMGAAHEQVDVKLIFLLAVKDPSVQVNVLQTIIELIQDQSTVNRLLNATTSEEIVKTLKTYSRSHT